MKETFETNLKNSQTEEGRSQSDFENVKATKTEQINAGQDQADMKTQELATTDEKNAQSKEDLEDTQAALESDTAFLADVKSKCESMDQDYEDRTTSRQGEIAAVGKALAFLNSDEAHDLFTRTFNMAFVQTRSVQNKAQREKVASLLKSVGDKNKDASLLSLAAKTRMDAFAEVKKNIQDMIDKLAKENA